MDALLPEDLVLPRTVAFDFIEGFTEPLEISSNNTIERRSFELTVYSTMRGDIADIVEVIYAGLHGGEDLKHFRGLRSFTIGKVYYDNFEIKYYYRAMHHTGKKVYSASMTFDAVATRSG